MEKTESGLCSRLCSILSKLGGRILSKKWLSVASALILTSAMIVYSQLELDSHSCHDMVEKGSWRYHHWHPYTCILQPQLNSGQVRRCLSGKSARRHVLMLGSTSLSYAFKDLVDVVNGSESYIVPPYLKEERRLFFASPEHKFTVEYLWQPALDDNALSVYEKLLTQPSDNTSNIVIVHQHPGFQPAPPHIVLRNLGDAVKMCKEKISTLAKLQKRYLEQKRNAPNAMIIMIIAELAGPEPALEIPKQCQEIAMEEYKALKEESKTVGDHLIVLKLPKYWPTVDKRPTSAIEVAIHFLCNSRQYGTCCIARDTYSAVILPVFALLIALQLGLWLVKITGGTLPLEPYVEGFVDLDKFYTLLGLLMAITLVSLYALLCDRIELFFKESVSVHPIVFSVLLVVIVCLGYLKTEPHPGSHTAFLPTELGTEAKGWLVLVLMTVEYTGMGGSRLWRLVLAMLVYLHCLSHCQYFWSTGNFSLLRVCKILLRENYLCVWMCLALHMPYFLYTLPALTSVSFFMVYLVMAVYPSLTAEKINAATPTYKLAAASKLVIAVIVLFVLTQGEEVWKLPFLRHFLVEEYDSAYSTTTLHYGMRYVPLVSIVTCYHLASAHAKGALVLSRRNPYVITLLLGNLCYFFLLVLQDSFGGQILQDILAALPVLLYITVRSWNEQQRGIYSTFYHHCGTVVNELYVPFRHVMLVHGGIGILTIFPRVYPLNLVATLVLWLLCVQSLSQALYAVRNYELSPTKQEASQMTQEDFPLPT